MYLDNVARNFLDSRFGAALDPKLRIFGSISTTSHLLYVWPLSALRSDFGEQLGTTQDIGIGYHGEGVVDGISYPSFLAVAICPSEH